MPLRRSAKKGTLSGKSIRSLKDFYDEISEQLEFPGHFGRNLDALWDVLVTDVAGPVEILWEDSGLSKSSMGKDFDRIANLLKEVEKERGDFKVRFH
jgi:ribonuclease inhibitor